jgi:hypothetical protein
LVAVRVGAKVGRDSRKAQWVIGEITRPFRTLVIVGVSARRVIERVVAGQKWATDVDVRKIIASFSTAQRWFESHSISTSITRVAVFSILTRLYIAAINK